MEGTSFKKHWPLLIFARFPNEKNHHSQGDRLSLSQGIFTVSKESACNAIDLGLIPGSEISPGEGNGNPFQYSCLENSMGRDYSPWDHKELDTTEGLIHREPWLLSRSRLV